MAFPSSPHPLIQHAPVYRSDAFRAIFGANEGDGLSFAADLMLDDVYALSAQAEAETLTLDLEDGCYVISPDSTAGTPGAKILLDCTVTLMGDHGPVVDLLVLVEVDPLEHAQNVYLLPLTPLAQKTHYRLLCIDTKNMAQKLAQMVCVSFTGGTKITLGCGRQCAVEELKSGDRVLTRDNGVQRIRWIGHSTQRATGVFAPIRIQAGTLNNARDLLVSSDHRLFIYQRKDHVGAGRAELMIKAGCLVNGDSVTRLEGGFIDYFQVLFDTHQIIYAEGIAAETMRADDTIAPLVDTATRNTLGNVTVLHRTLSELDVPRDLLNRPDAVEVLRRASKG